MVEENTVAKKQQNDMVVFRAELARQEQQFALALPAQIPAERFVRTLVTTVQMHPELLGCTRKSLFASAMRAAQDGLLMDGREAVAVVFKTQKHGILAQYIPMYAGIVKKMRNSGEIASIAAHCVYEKDTFSYELGDDEHIKHVPFLGAERGKFIAVYAIVKMKDGGIVREVMSRADVEKVRQSSRAKDSGPWVSWYDEMARKTVIKRIAKRCPSSADLEKVIEQDNQVLGLEAQRMAPIETDAVIIEPEPEKPTTAEKVKTKLERKPIAREPEPAPEPQEDLVHWRCAACEKEMVGDPPFSRTTDDDGGADWFCSLACKEA